LIVLFSLRRGSGREIAEKKKKEEEEEEERDLLVLVDWLLLVTVGCCGCCCSYVLEEEERRKKKEEGEVDGRKLGRDTSEARCLQISAGTAGISVKTGSKKR